MQNLNIKRKFKYLLKNLERFQAYEEIWELFQPVPSLILIASFKTCRNYYFVLDRSKAQYLTKLNWDKDIKI